MENSLPTVSVHKQKKRGRAVREEGEKEVVKIERVFSTELHEKNPSLPTLSLSIRDI